MCERCKIIERRIEQYQSLGRQIGDRRTLDALIKLTQELEAEKLALHPSD